MNESLINQYSYFIQKAETIEAVEFQESKILRSYGYLPEKIKKVIEEKKTEFCNKEKNE